MACKSCKDKRIREELEKIAQKTERGIIIFLIIVFALGFYGLYTIGEKIVNSF